jgi:hypothetical protein
LPRRATVAVTYFMQMTNDEGFYFTDVFVRRLGKSR